MSALRPGLWRRVARPARGRPVRIIGAAKGAQDQLFRHFQHRDGPCGVIAGEDGVGGPRDAPVFHSRRVWRGVRLGRRVDVAREVAGRAVEIGVVDRAEGLARRHMDLPRGEIHEERVSDAFGLQRGSGRA